MAFSDPNGVHNPATSSVIPASWGDLIRDDLIALYGKPCVRVHKSASAGVADTTLTVVTFDSEDGDSHTMHDTVTNAGRLTIPTGWDGEWLLWAAVQWEPNGGGQRRHAEIKNNGGAKLVDSDITPSSPTGYATQNLLCTWTLYAGDWVELSVFHDAGSTINVQSDGWAGTVFGANFIRAGVAG